jgi:predicted short-subunit dehydrogenase-like oxidoreductase (DUF2520 family)
LLEVIAGFDLADAGWRLASAHPVFSFANPAIAIGNFPGTLCGIEGDVPAMSVAQRLFETIGARSFPIRTEAKAIDHAAAGSQRT